MTASSRRVPQMRLVIEADHCEHAVRICQDAVGGEQELQVSAFARPAVLVEFDALARVP